MPGPEETYAVAADRRPVTDARQRQIDALRSELVHYTRIGQDWEGYGGQPGNPHALLDALRFLSRPGIFRACTGQRSRLTCSPVERAGTRALLRPPPGSPHGAFPGGSLPGCRNRAKK
ncbi:MAG: hypothetical protein V7849_03280 [Candidatus Competibacter sp.]